MLSLIVAMDEKRVIGFENKMPWHLPNDLKYFKRQTEGSTVIMGRKTFESIGKPLPNRQNVIMTRNKNYEQNGCKVIHKWEDIDHLRNEEESFIIGGAELFKHAIDIVDRMYITIIHNTFDGDTYFPDFDENEWKLVEEIDGETDDKNIYDHTFLIYERVE
nr:dihydrofolate reductase [Halalkalibacillus halophilus]